MFEDVLEANRAQRAAGEELTEWIGVPAESLAAPDAARICGGQHG
jgi:hypothetical protein